MTAAAAALDELERDALTELVNIGVSNAASSLRKMVGAHVLLSVPAVEVLDRRAAASLISEREADLLVAVKQDFSGPITGHAMLIFPQGNSLDLVRAVAGEALSKAEAIELEPEALAETGNVILNGCLGTIANMLHRTILLSVPVVLRGDGAELFQVAAAGDGESVVLFLYINFIIKHRNIRGYIAMLLDLPSMAALKLLIAEFIDNVMSDADPAGGGGTAMRESEPFVI